MGLLGSERTSLDEFGLTVEPRPWPEGVSIPQPAVWKIWDIEIGDDHARIVDVLPRPQDIHVEDEFYLREFMRLDISPPDDAISEWINHTGLVFSGGSSTADTPSGWLGAFAVNSLRESGRLSQIEQRREDLKARATYGFETFDEIRRGVAWLRDLTRMWIAFSYVGSFRTEALWESEEHGIARPRTEDDARHAFASGLSAAMRPFSPRLIYRQLDIYRTPSPLRPSVQGVTKPQRAARETALDFHMPPLYSVIALQLYNHVVERATYKECASETCSNLFVRQVRQGKAKYAPHIEGVKFCSRRCAQAQSQREWRRRQKEGSKG